MYIHLAWWATYLSDDVRFASGIMDLSFRTIRLPPFDWQNSLALGHDNGLSYFKILSGCGASDFTGSNKSTYLLCFEIWEHERSLIFDWLTISGTSLYFRTFLEVPLLFVVLVSIETVDVVDDVIGRDGVVVVYSCWSKAEIKIVFFADIEYHILKTFVLHKNNINTWNTLNIIIGFPFGILTKFASKESLMVIFGICTP